MTEYVCFAFFIVSDFNVDEFVEGRKVLPKANKCVRCVINCVLMNKQPYA